MSNEIHVGASLQVAKNGATFGVALTKDITQSASGTNLDQEVDIPSSGSVRLLNIIAATESPAVFIQNLDATNYVQFAINNFSEVFAKLLPGEVMLFRPNPALASCYARSQSAAMKIRLFTVGE